MNKIDLRDPLSQLTQTIIGRAIEVHRHLGPGLLESAYEVCLAYELGKAGLSVERQVSLPVMYKDIQLDQGYRIDLWVNRKVVVELKVVEQITAVHEAQILSYLKFSGCDVGLLINFNVKLLKDGLRRYALSAKNSQTLRESPRLLRESPRYFFEDYYYDDENE